MDKLLTSQKQYFSWDIYVDALYCQKTQIGQDEIIMIRIRFLKSLLLHKRNYSVHKYIIYKG